jgi:hypothetical protein
MQRLYITGMAYTSLGDEDRYPLVPRLIKKILHKTKMFLDNYSSTIIKT